MVELIDKAALVAEIEKRIKEEMSSSCVDYFGYSEGKVEAFRNILSFLNTLEVKEVDLKIAIDKWIDDTAITHEDCSVADVISTAKHFFELGLKAQKGE